MKANQTLAIAGCITLLTACGQATATSHAAASTSGGATPAWSSLTASPTAPASGTLFAVLETRQCPAVEPAACASIFSGMHDTVAIAGSDGYAKAKTGFAARQIPPSGNAATVMDLEGQVVAGAVYFVDGSGTVRRITAAGTTSIVAQFSINSAQQAISFAVRPDGKQVIAAILTYPVNTPSTGPNQPPWGTFSGPWQLKIESASAGGATTILHQWQTATSVAPGSQGGFDDIWLAGWDADGPIALVGQATATQNAWLNNQRFFAGHLARLNADGTAGATIGAPDCLPYWRPTNGRFVCTTINNTATPIDVVDLAGKVLWSGSAVSPQPGIPGDFVPSLDGTRLAMDGEVVDLKDNATVKLAPDFQPLGWLDGTTLIGLIPVPHAPAHLGVVHLSNPLHAEDWGFSGAYVGLL